ncbi:hypothetical protein GOP47_0001630 [Adiantum capillus-veneris]|uniref:Serine-threonine/tyrosine-protein kinase catalytic domain-containing protein n=1 Tax=Adiantum capillus-veneris TaxID=13818 RepID=A0A9D4V978_ADICA|nr:hypothetical protein GOP47_0001630 [Adiantum capillus-veneris]
MREGERGQLQAMAGGSEQQQRAIRGPHKEGDMPEIADVTAAIWIGADVAECIHGEPLTKESEVYSFGVLVFELLTRQVPETCILMLGMPLERWVRAVLPSMRTQIVDYVVLQTAPTEEHVVALLKVALSCTEEEPKLRPTILEIISKLQKFLNLDYVPEEEDARDLDADIGTSSPPIHSRFEEPIAAPFKFFA